MIYYTISQIIFPLSGVCKERKHEMPSNGNSHVNMDSNELPSFEGQPNLPLFALYFHLALDNRTTRDRSTNRQEKLSDCVLLAALGTIVLRAASHHLPTQVAIMVLASPAEDVIVVPYLS